jgi:hypothetical protein
VRVKPKNELNAEQLALFDARMHYWQDRLGLNDWRLEKSKRKTRNMADIKIFHRDRLCTYAVGDFGAAAITDELIDKTACHECVHLLLAELLNVVSVSDDDDLQMAAEHRVVTTLENLLTKAT